MRSTFFDEILKRVLGKRFKPSDDTTPLTLSSAIEMSATELTASFEARTAKGGDLKDLVPDIEKAVEEQLKLLVGDMVTQDVFDKNDKKVVRRSEKIKAPSIDVGTKLRDRRGRVMSPMSLARILNLALSTYIRKNMGVPALVYRTGRLANSASINEITKGKQKFSIFFSYMTAPYATFDKGGKQYGDGRRSPTELIRKSIRQALEETLSAKSYKNRFIIRGKDL